MSKWLRHLRRLQRTKKDNTRGVDMRLGILLFEMCCPFNMHRLTSVIYVSYSLNTKLTSYKCFYLKTRDCIHKVSSG